VCGTDTVDSDYCSYCWEHRVCHVCKITTIDALPDSTIVDIESVFDIDDDICNEALMENFGDILRGESSSVDATYHGLDIVDEDHLITWRCIKCQRYACPLCIAVSGCDTPDCVCSDCYIYICNKCNLNPIPERKGAYNWYLWDADPRPFCDECIVAELTQR